MTKRLCMRCYISGKVQGVWFRAFAKQGAEKLGINGWAHNLNDGRVEIFACGDEEALEVFSVWLKKGPELAQVTHYTRDNLPWEDYTGFHIL